jgi:hypothetical protein
MKEPPSEPTTATVTRAKIPPTVWTLGFVSIFMDVSSEIVHSRLPLFLVSTLVAESAPSSFRGTAVGTSSSHARIDKPYPFPLFCV